LLRPIPFGQLVGIPNSAFDKANFLTNTTCHIIQQNFNVFLYLCNWQVANNLDRMVSTLGRNRLKVLVQVNTSGEECKFSSKQ
jgi:uncharacterized pyridoxal phosphate-containing UPF0001 family protein